MEAWPGPARPGPAWQATGAGSDNSRVTGNPVTQAAGNQNTDQSRTWPPSRSHAGDCDAALAIGALGLGAASRARFGAVAGGAGSDRGEVRPREPGSGRVRFPDCTACETYTPSGAHRFRLCLLASASEKEIASFCSWTRKPRSSNLENSAPELHAFSCSNS